MVLLFMVLIIFHGFLFFRVDILSVPNRGVKNYWVQPKKRIPPWLPKQNRVVCIK